MSRRPVIGYSCPVRYRLYQAADFEPLYAIEEACFQPPLRFPRRYMRRLVTSPRAATWVAEDGRAMAGFAIVEWLKAPDASVAYIETLEVVPGRRGQGIGGELLRRMEDSARAAGASIIWLHVDAENAAAIRLYEAHGYEPQGREENFYPEQRPALVYAKSLPHAQEKEDGPPGGGEEASA
ncbi:MAG: GNAT family N-acetyltransferase [Acidobacteriota bacterium]